MTAKRPRALCAGTLRRIGINADCFVLDDHRRVLSQSGILRALSDGGAETGDDTPGNKNFGRFLDRLPNKPKVLSSPPFEFYTLTNSIALGRSEEWFVALLKTLKAAHRDGLLRPQQIKYAIVADQMLDALVGVGLRALIDEATGFQSVRASDDLARLYERLLLNQPDTWERTWPERVVRSLCRTYRIRMTGRQMPAPMSGVIGWIYRLVIGEDVHEEIRRRNPRPPGGRRTKHHQFWADELRKLATDHLKVILAFSDTSRDAEDFKARMLAHYHREPFQMDFPDA